VVAAREGHDEAAALQHQVLAGLPARGQCLQEGGLPAEADDAAVRQAAQRIALAQRLEGDAGLDREAGRQPQRCGDLAVEEDAGAAARPLGGRGGADADRTEADLGGDVRPEAGGLGRLLRQAGAGQPGEQRRGGAPHAASPRMAGTSRPRLWRNIAS
jgi:hypothetical protein